MGSPCLRLDQARTLSSPARERSAVVVQMKTPLWFPQSFFARTLWLVLIVVLFSKALTLVYLLMNEDVLVDRQYSHGVALTLRAYWAADEENRDKIAEAAGLIRSPAPVCRRVSSIGPTARSTNARCRPNLAMTPRCGCASTRRLPCGSTRRAWAPAG